MAWERVRTVHDYHDGPRLGVADFCGHPCAYQCIFDPVADEYSDQFQLTPLTDELLSLIMEGWRTWLQWRKTYRAGEVPLESHPAFSEDKHHRTSLARILEDLGNASSENSLIKVGRFRRIGVEDFEVEWVHPPPSAHTQ